GIVSTSPPCAGCASPIHFSATRMTSSTTVSQTVSAADALRIDTEVVLSLLVGFVREEVHKVGFQRVVVGLSGGVDSAVTAAVAQRALGPDDVVPVIMPYRSSSPASEADA